MVNSYPFKSILGHAPPPLSCLPSGSESRLPKGGIYCHSPLPAVLSLVLNDPVTIPEIPKPIFQYIHKYISLHLSLLSGSITTAF